VDGMVFTGSRWVWMILASDTVPGACRVRRDGRATFTASVAGVSVLQQPNEFCASRSGVGFGPDARPRSSTRRTA